VISHATSHTLHTAYGIVATRTVITELGPVRGLLSGPADDTQKVFGLESSPLLLLDALVS
jgi:hypothetical protein